MSNSLLVSKSSNQNNHTEINSGKSIGPVIKTIEESPINHEEIALGIPNRKSKKFKGQRVKDDATDKASDNEEVQEQD